MKLKFDKKIICILLVILIPLLILLLLKNKESFSLGGSAAPARRREQKKIKKKAKKKLKQREKRVKKMAEEINTAIKTGKINEINQRYPKLKIEEAIRSDYPSEGIQSGIKKQIEAEEKEVLREERERVYMKYMKNTGIDPDNLKTDPIRKKVKGQQNEVASAMENMQREKEEEGIRLLPEAAAKAVLALTEAEAKEEEEGIRQARDTIFEQLKRSPTTKGIRNKNIKKIANTLARQEKGQSIDISLLEEKTETPTKSRLNNLLRTKRRRQAAKAAGIIAAGTVGTGLALSVATAAGVTGGFYTAASFGYGADRMLDAKRVINSKIKVNNIRKKGGWSKVLANQKEMEQKQKKMEQTQNQRSSRV